MTGDRVAVVDWDFEKLRMMPEEQISREDAAVQVGTEYANGFPVTERMVTGPDGGRTRAVIRWTRTGRRRVITVWMFPA